MDVVVLQHGNAAIHESAWNGFSKTLELLVKFDADISLVNKVWMISDFFG